MLRRRLTSAAVVLAALVLMGCTPQKTIQAMQKMAQVAIDPDVPLGPPKDQPSIATVTVYAEKNINRNEFGEPAPVDVWLFQLNDDIKLRTTDFITLSEAPKDALGISYVSHKEMQIEPGKSEIVLDWEMNKETVAIGIAVGFKNIDQINWRTTERVKAKGEIYKVLAVIRGQDVAIEAHR